jgi:hypothetical protein
MLLILIRFDTVPERRRAAGAAREEEVEGAEGAISRHWCSEGVLTSSFEFQFTTRYVGQQLNSRHIVLGMGRYDIIMGDFLPTYSLSDSLL